MPKFIDAVGLRFGRLTVIEKFLEPKKSTGTYWVCRCDCGEITTAQISKLRSGHTQSCGCFRLERQREANTTHGMRRTRAYHSWAAMKDRCLNPRSHKAHLYSERGIDICPEWRNSFEAFYRDMGDPPHGHTLDRKEADKGYSKENCRWATPLQQANNLRTTKRIEWQGRTQTITEWAQELGVNRALIALRLKRGWSANEALTGFRTTS